MASILADRTREGWFRALVNDSTDGVLVLDKHGVVVYTSPRVDAEFDFAAADGSPSEFSDLLVEQSAAEIRLLLAQASLDPSRAGPYDLILRGRGERAVEVEATLRPITDIEFEGFVVTVRDVSDTRRLQRQLANSRRRDELTGLLSREALLADLSLELDEGDPELSVAVAVLDLERFGRLNDGLGHEAGDEILVAVARTFERLPEEVRSVARVGADSFALLVVGEHPGRCPGRGGGHVEGRDARAPAQQRPGDRADLPGRVRPGRRRRRAAGRVVPGGGRPGARTVEVVAQRAARRLRLRDARRDRAAHRGRAAAASALSPTAASSRGSSRCSGSPTVCAAEPRLSHACGARTAPSRSRPSSSRWPRRSG